MTDSATTRVLLLGATGLVGHECLRLLLEDPAVGIITAPTRRPLSGIAGPGGDRRVLNPVMDLDHLVGHPELFRVDTIICALGSTMRSAGSQPAFRRVDHGYVTTAARIGLAQGARHYILVSSMGADPGSRIFYNRVKGEAERDVSAMGYPAVTILRPSLLLGKRTEFRLGEQVAMRLAWAIPGKYRPVAATAVATAAVRALRRADGGVQIMESSAIRRTARSHRSVA
jgi:uncharacterized protein YbjT (DUF2867 family)